MVDIIKTDGTLLTTVPRFQVNTTASPIVLLGDGADEYGQSVMNNFIRIVENFANLNPPNPPLLGQLWYDTNDNVLKVNTDLGFQELTTGDIGQAVQNELASSGVVSSLNSLSGDLDLTGSGGIAIQPSTFTINIDASSLESRISTLEASSGSGVLQLNTRTGTVTISGTQGITVGGSGNDIQISGADLSNDISGLDTRVTNLEGSSGSGSVTSVDIASTTLTASGGPITGSGTLTVELPSVVTAGSFTNANITIDTFGRVTSASNGTSGGSSDFPDVRAGGTPVVVDASVFDFDAALFNVSDLGGNQVAISINSAAVVAAGGGGGGGLPTGTEGQFLVADNSGNFVPNSNLTGPATGWQALAGNSGSGRLVIQPSESALAYNDGSNNARFFTGPNAVVGAIREGTTAQGALVIGVDTVNGNYTSSGLSSEQPDGTNAGNSVGRVALQDLNFDLWSSGQTGTAPHVIHTEAMSGGIQLPRGASADRPTFAQAQARQSGQASIPRSLLGMLRWNLSGSVPEIAIDNANNWMSIQMAAATPDLAEMFETFNQTALIPGTTVVMDTVNPGYIRAAQPGEESQIIGVVRPKDIDALVLGEQNEWPQKNLRDSYGGFIYDDVEWNNITVTYNQDGKTTSLTFDQPSSNPLPNNPSITNVTVNSSYNVPTKRVNPAYDPELTYLPRKQRDEWQIVGLTGQVPITKGQPINPNWIYIKEVDAQVDMYLIK